MARSLSLVPLAQLSLLAGQEHGRTIPLADIGHIDQHANLRYRLQINFWLGEV
jgi:hypothetical protein